jgi:hypothetical protein
VGISAALHLLSFAPTVASACQALSPLESVQGTLFPESCSPPGGSGDVRSSTTAPSQPAHKVPWPTSEFGFGGIISADRVRFAPGSEALTSRYHAGR